MRYVVCDEIDFKDFLKAIAIYKLIEEDNEEDDTRTHNAIYIYS